MSPEHRETLERLHTTLEWKMRKKLTGTDEKTVSHI